MVKLRNIDRNTVNIWCDYYPECEKQSGKVVVDIATGEVMEAWRTEYERDLMTMFYVNCVASKLNEIKHLDKLPEKASYVWY